MANRLIERRGENIEVHTKTPGAYVNGRWVEGTATTVTIKAAIMPLALSEMATEVSEAGLETKDAIAIYTEYALKEADENEARNRDTVVRRGNEYVIKVVVDRYQIPSLKHFKAVAVLKDS